jgi:ribosome-associated toxin RatA of RatAB toxin-antitoxin module
MPNPALSHASQPSRATARRASRDGMAFFEIQAVGTVRAAQADAWKVLSDYERLPEFVPGLLTSKIVSRKDHVCLVEQESRAGFLFLSQRLRMQVRIEELPASGIEVSLVSGDVRHYRAHWQLEALPDAAGTRVSLTAEIEPAIYLPPLFGIPIMQESMRQMVQAVTAEIERRAG